MKNLLITGAICVTLGCFGVEASQNVMSGAPCVKSKQPACRIVTQSRAAGVATRLAPFNTIQDLYGEYEWNNTSLLDYSRPNSVEMIVSDELAAQNKVQVNLYLPYVTITNPLMATVDMENGTFTLDNMQEIGHDEDGKVFFYLKDAEWDDTTGEGVVCAGASADPSVTGVINGNTVKFPDKSIFAVGNPEAEEVGAWIMTNNNSFIGAVLPEGNPNEGWKSLGNATLQDGWVCPRFKIDQTDPSNWYEVELQQNQENPNIYRLVDPYHGNSSVAGYNISRQVGYIQFDMTDPDNVMFDPVESGFANLGLIGYSKLYCINQLRLWTTQLEMDPSDIISYGMSYSTFKDGVVTLPRGSEDAGFYNDACVGWQLDPCAGAGWLNGYEPANMETKIFFPKDVSGISDTLMDSEASEEYYNIHGMPVQNPSKGELVICKKGNKAFKIIIR